VCLRSAGTAAAGSLEWPPTATPGPAVTEPFVLMQHLLPKRAMTGLAGRLASARAGAWTHAAIRRFVARYGVDMAEAADPRIESYATFNDFFTRALKPGARPIADATWICPVDGAISQFGRIERDRIFQAARFEDGWFATLYLSPRDYHRIHMPCEGRLRRMVHVPGSLYSVNPATARGIPGLFARNERVVCLFDTAHGPFVLVLVGATIVGSMATAWHGVVNPQRPGTVRAWDYDAAPIVLAQGAEMGRFMLGSTVVMLWPALSLRFEPSWSPGRSIRLGEAMADADLPHGA